MSARAATAGSSACWAAGTVALLLELALMPSKSVSSGSNGRLRALLRPPLPLIASLARIVPDVGWAEYFFANGATRASTAYSATMWSSSNRAVAVSMAGGSAAALELVNALPGGNARARHHLLPGVGADPLVKLSRPDEASDRVKRAARLTHNEREHDLL